MNPSSTMNPSSIFDYKVYDRNGEKVGKVENVWTDSDGRLAYIGVSTGWLGLGKNHIVPGAGASIDPASESVRVAYDEETIKASSSYDLSTDLNDIETGRLSRHFGTTADCGCETSTAGARSTARARSTAESKEVEVPLAEEKLRVGKREVSLGEVRLRKVVRTERVSAPVELRHEEVVVERVSDRGRTPGDKPFVEEVVTIPVKTEEAVVQKTVESAGAVKATKKSTARRENVSETVRKEDVEVERDLAGARRK